MIYCILGGKNKGRKCVILSEGAQVTNIAQVAFLDGTYNEVDFVEKGWLSALDLPGHSWIMLETCEKPYDLREYLQRQQGNGSNMLRTDYVAQPRALRKADVLATNESIVGDSRIGYNSSIIIHLSESGWVELAPRLPIALTGNIKFCLPIKLKKKQELITGCQVSKNSASLRPNWTTIFLADCGNNGFDIPSCIPLALA
jgi:hypothetical protein